MHEPIFYIMSLEVNNINEYIQTVRQDNNYWMVRTMGGAYYEEFAQNGFIAIGHNDILLREINSLRGDLKHHVRQLKETVKHHYIDVERPGYIASQLVKFCEEIKKGDIVLVPGSYSYDISICEVTGNVYEETNVRENAGRCPFMKRIPVRILRQTKRVCLPPRAQLMFNSRHPISCINDYAVYLDNTCSDYYNKNEETHLVLRIETEDSVSVETFYNIQRLFQLAETFCNEIGLEGNSNEVEMKVQMESPGLLHFISRNKNYLATIGLLIMLINGGGLEINHGNFHMNLNTPGIIQSCSNFLDRQEDRGMQGSIRHSLDSLKIKTPEDFQKAMIEMMKVQNERRNTY